MNQLDCVISYFFQLYLILHACVERFDVMDTVGKNLGTKRGLYAVASALLFVILFFCSFEASVKSTRPWFRRCLLFCWSVRSYTWKYFWLRHFKELHLHLVSIHHYPLWLSGYHNNVGNLSKRTLIYLKIGNAYIYMEYIVSRSIS